MANAEHALPLFVALLVGGALGSVPARAADPVVAAAPSAAPVIEVTVGTEERVELEAVTEAIVVESDGVRVYQVGPTTLSVTADRVGGRASVLLRGTGRVGVLVFEGVAKADGRRPATGTQGSPFAPRIGLGGNYTVQSVLGATPALGMYHWGSYAQRSERLAVDGFVGVTRTTTPEWALSSLHLDVDAPRWSARAGDMHVVLAPGISGLNGAVARLRGVSGAVRPVDGPLQVGATVGAGRSFTCCGFFEPEELLVAGGSAGWLPERGAWVDGFAGLMRRRDDVRPVPIATVSGGYRGDRNELEGRLSQAGRGTSGTVLASSQVSPDLAWYAHAGAQSEGFETPAYGRPEPWGGAAITGVRYDRDEVRIDAEAYGRNRGATDDIPSLGRVGGRANVAWRPSEALGLGGSYERFAEIGPATDRTGDLLGANLHLSPVMATRIGLAAYGSFISDLSPGLFASAVAQLAPSATWRASAAYHLSRPPGSSRTQHLLRGSTTYHQDRFDWSVQTGWRRSTEATPVPDDLSLSSFAAVRPVSFLEVGLGGNLTYRFEDRPLGWSAQATWTFYPARATRQAEDLGFRGRIRGVVYRDDDQDGVRDPEEPTLAGIPVSVDEHRQTVTGDDGTYRFAGLPPGEHVITIDRGSLHALTATRQVQRVQPFQTSEVDFALAWGARIQGVLYEDLHADGVFDNGDPTIGAEQVMLRDDRGVVIERVRADDGRFVFPGLPAGEYTVIVDTLTLREGYRPVDALEQEVVLEEGEAANLAMRLEAARAIGGILWEDVDRDGKGGGARDLGIGGAEVYLSDGQVTRSGPDGSFLFRELAPGAYAVSTELSDETRVILLPEEPQEVLDLSFVYPRGTRPAQPHDAPPSRPSRGVAGIALDAPIDVLPQGVILQVTATAVLSNGESREVTTRARWASSDDEVLSVDRRGRVEGKRGGAAGVTAEYEGRVADPLEFEVLDDPLDTVQVSPVGLRLNPGDTADLRVDVVDRSGRGGAVTPIAGWTAADPTIVRIDDEGVLHALRDGTTTIQARIGDAWSKPLEVRVITAPVTALSVEGTPARMPEGASVYLRATGYDTRLQIQDVSDQVRWSSTDPEVLEVDDEGRITAVGRGTAQITASIGSLFTRSRVIAVTNVPPVALEVLPPAMTLRMGDRQDFRARATFEDGSRGSVTGVVEWLVDGAAARVSSDGTVIPEEPGEVTVRARYLGVESTPVTVTVER